MVPEFTMPAPAAKLTLLILMPVFAVICPLLLILPRNVATLLG